MHIPSLHDTRILCKIRTEFGGETAIGRLAANSTIRALGALLNEHGRKVD